MSDERELYERVAKLAETTQERVVVLEQGQGHKDFVAFVLSLVKRNTEQKDAGVAYDDSWFDSRSMTESVDHEDNCKILEEVQKTTSKLINKFSNELGVATSILAVNERLVETILVLCANLVSSVDCTKRVGNKKMSNQVYKQLVRGFIHQMQNERMSDHIFSDIYEGHKRVHKIHEEERRKSRN